ncbi:glyceraldehyde-3-phosphate dehydrogenase [Brachybacterium endophyticum]|uniref:Glyceraldehyde-3-phosphate dehydrogenase n=2 Tax=Brachybacterium endophyticum TaxID=2182385 RepID=A0A2U2RPZ2_9MICO|nr:glyceraldehyde-3-phosphate dehydrogenase [Brachybacterium endophyticum]
MIPIIGSLYRTHHVVTTIHGRRLVDLSAQQILKAHRFARHIDGTELDPADSFPLLQTLAATDVPPSVVDLASLLALGRERPDEGAEELLHRELARITPRPATGPTDIVVYGFGRIGRLLTRILLARSGGADGLRLRAVVVRPGSDEDLVKRASLLRRDSVHGPFQGTITVDAERRVLVANGIEIQVIESPSPDAVDYTEHGIDEAIVVDTTGRWRDREGLEQHLRSRGVRRVLLTAPGKGDVPNIVHGVNDDEIGDHAVLAAASCTTNAVAPVLKALHEHCGVERGHVETVHAFTNDQNLTDNFHTADRRGRAATLNMVIAETGAARAVGAAYPPLAGRLTGSAIRVPVPNVSLAVLNLRLGAGAQSMDREQLNAFLRETSLASPLRRQVDYIESPEFASSDGLGSRKAGIVDGLATIADGGGDAVLYVWYDNEHGYCRQVVRVLESMAGGRLPSIPEGAVARAKERVRSGRVSV